MESSRQRSRSPHSESQQGTTDSPRPRSQSPLTESQRRREDRLRKRRERERNNRASESAEEREVRLRRRRERERARRASETAEQRQSRLQQLTTNQQQRLESETPEQRESRLQQLTTNQQQTLESETAEQRESRLQQLATNRQQRLESEMPEQRESRQQQNRQSQREARARDLQLPSEKFPGVKVKSTGRMHECVRCSHDRHIPKLYSSFPTCISAVVPIMSIYRLPLGQYWYSGHVINLPQDVASFAASLPRLPSELDVIVVRKEGANQSHRDFRVRRSVVHRALEWLVTHNIYYCANQIHISQDALALLPQDGSQHKK